MIPLTGEILASVTAVDLYFALAAVLVVAGAVRMLLERDLARRLVAMNVVGVGSLLVLMALGARASTIDPVLSALVITGLVITVAFTGVGAVLIRRLESPTLRDLDRADAHQEPDEQERRGDQA